ncbi:hypothetical protein LCGC14_1834510 [marine sediment metagenome]|uniref:Uncharacterized protein n=1 Tax=marine sediment metagenome TaxID=412755 RepID=A0A0F9GF23_9ZZZZ
MSEDDIGAYERAIIKARIWKELFEEYLEELHERVEEERK